MWRAVLFAILLGALTRCSSGLTTTCRASPPVIQGDPFVARAQNTIHFALPAKCKGTPVTPTAATVLDADDQSVPAAISANSGEVTITFTANGPGSYHLNATFDGAAPVQANFSVLAPRFDAGFITLPAYCVDVQRTAAGSYLCTTVEGNEEVFEAGVSDGGHWAPGILLSAGNTVWLTSSAPADAGIFDGVEALRDDGSCLLRTDGGCLPWLDERQDGGLLNGVIAAAAEDNVVLWREGSLALCAPSATPSCRSVTMPDGGFSDGVVATTDSLYVAVNPLAPIPNALGANPAELLCQFTLDGGSLSDEAPRCTRVEGFLVGADGRGFYLRTAATSFTTNTLTFRRADDSGLSSVDVEALPNAQVVNAGRARVIEPYLFGPNVTQFPTPYAESSDFTCAVGFDEGHLVFELYALDPGEEIRGSDENFVWARSSDHSRTRVFFR